MSAEIWNQVFWKNSKSSELLSRLSSPLNEVLKQFSSPDKDNKLTVWKVKRDHSSHKYFF